MSQFKVATPVLRGIFQEKWNDLRGNIGLEAAPARKVDSIDGAYTVQVTPDVLDLSASGFDADVALSLRAPSREIEVNYESRAFSVDRQAYSQVITDLSAMHMEAAGAGSPNEQIGAAMTGLARRFADLHAYKVGKLYNDDANFDSGALDGLDLTDPTEDVLGKLESAIGQVRRYSGASEVAVIVNGKTAQRLRVHPSILQLIAVGNQGNQVSTMEGLKAIFRDQFGARLLVSETRIHNGSLEFSTIADDTLAVAALSGNSGFEATYAHTVTIYDAVEGLCDVYMFEQFDPRGVKVVAESVYKVEAVDKSLGFRFTVV